MSYQIAYTTQFHSLENVLWKIEIYINDYVGRPVEIKLEGDEPCVIDWQETGKTDVVQSSTCTLRVSNESDRQMVQLMNHPDAAVLVSRNGFPYWFGHLDDSIYEEPYSYKKAYVTELIFSDFGILNRLPFKLKGKQSVNAIVRDCLDSIGYGSATINLYTSLLEPKTLRPITLDMLYINADRFEPEGDSWDAMTSKREVLEEILRPLGFRIMQKNGQIFIYDIEYLRDHDLSNHVVWKGTDAYLRGSETFGWYEVAFNTDAKETLAGGGLDYDSDQWVDSERNFCKSYDEETGTDGITGFYIETRDFLHGISMQKSADARFFRTRSVFTESNDIGVAWRATCKTITGYYQNPHLPGMIAIVEDKILVDNLPAWNLAGTQTVFSIEAGYLPLIPDRGKFQLRVNLDFLLSFRDNPLDSPPDEWVERQPWYGFLSNFKESRWRWCNFFAHMVPVMLEVLDDEGQPVLHYRNAHAEDIEKQFYQNIVHVAKVEPRGVYGGEWVQGGATFGEMFLAYYKDYDPDDTDRDPLVTSGWVGNRIALSHEREINGTLYRIRNDGEYLPLPPEAGRLRLTVGSGVFPFYDEGFYPAFCYNMAWQLYRNPSITLVKANRKDDGIGNDTIYERDVPGLNDLFSESLQAGSYQKGISPSARGLLFNGKGIVWEKFVKNGQARTLQEHRLKCHIDQVMYTQPVLSGTAELDTVFLAKREGSTPGIFLVTRLRQDLHEDLEEVTMARIANAGGYVYEFAWSNPFCVQEEPSFAFAWSNPFCVQERQAYGFSWSNGICAKGKIGINLEWMDIETEQHID